MATGHLFAGFGRRDITPRNPCFLVGYPDAERTSTGVNDPLFASALCLQSGENAVLIMAFDLLFVPSEWARECREAIGQRTGLRPECILFGATHTHSGPHTADVLAWREDPVVPPVDPAYIAFLHEQTLAAAEDAWNAKVPAEAAWTTAMVARVAGGNRIDPEGPEDPEAGLLLVRDTRTQNPLAVVSIYGMHPTVLHEDSTVFSGDFIGLARAFVESALPGVGMVYLNGVCGNQSPRRIVSAQTLAEAERIGRGLGERFVKALSNVRNFTADFPVAAKSRWIEIEGRKFPSVSEAEKNHALHKAKLEELRSGEAPRAVVRTAECALFGAREVLTLARAEEQGDAAALREQYRHAEIQFMRLGTADLAAWPGEFFVEYGLEVKARACRRMFIVTMANGDLQGYIVTPEAEAVGGYEAQMSLFPSSVGARFVEETLKLSVSLP